ncbi:MAG: Flp pilus assembly complex ATPase component TadA [Armatimonadetes bacterium]|nr:Flp pilus assembly complex ATPase component TadA [Armatimonadota bacterium]
MWDVAQAKSLDELWKSAIAFLTVELSTGRALVLHEEDPEEDFTVCSTRGIPADQVWDDESVDFDLLKAAYGDGRPQVTEGRALCLPLKDGAGRVIGLLYGDRLLERLDDHTLANGQRFAETFSRKLVELRTGNGGGAAGTRNRSRIGGKSFRVLLRLTGQGILDEEKADLAMAEAEASAREVEDVLLEKGWVTHEQVGRQPPPPLAEPSIPRERVVGGRYLILDEMMLCRFSTLYRAMDRVNGSPVVLRKLEESVGGEARREARLQTLREGRLLSRLKHQNLPEVHEVLLEDEGDLYLVLEEIKGQPLDRYLTEREEPLEPELLRRYLRQFLSVIGYLHAQQPPIVHRDLRPETVLISPVGVLKIVEFGLAKMLEAEEPATPSRQTSFRAHGSPHFAAPEQLLGEPSHPANDLYSIGAILYYLATRKEPPEAVERCLGRDTLVPLAELRPDLPPELAAVIQLLLSPQQENRPRDVGELTLPEGQQVAEPERVMPRILVPEAPPAPETPPGTDGAAPAGAAEAPPQPGAKPRRMLSMWELLFGRGKKKQVEQEAGPDDHFAEQYRDRFPTIDLAEFALDPEVGRVLPESISRSIQGVCIGRVGADEITVAVKDPTDVHIYDHVAVASQNRLKPTLVRGDSDMIDHAIEFVYRGALMGEESSWLRFLEQKQLHAATIEVTSGKAERDFGDEEIEGPVVDAVDRLIKEAISAGASDIHLEPYAKQMDLRYRIDGVLHRVDNFPPEFASSMVKRVKVMGNLDIAQERVTQGGRISLRIGGEQEYDLRVSVIPVPGGESVVMRILKKGSFNLTLSDLGFGKEKEDRFRNILSQPYGMILVCGPTGSGKSTTLYACLKEIQRPDRKLLTVEDPIEYQMGGIMQVQVNVAPREAEKKVTFSRALREFLRQDPDVILVGEIRDPETAEIAIQAALTGHLLLSTLHTNDSVGIVARLVDMGCEPFLVGATLIGGLAQRLARRICPDCREEVPVPGELLHLFEENGIDQPRMFRGTGCRACNHTGHRGRVGLFELLEVTSDLRALVNRHAPEEEIRAVAASQGFQPLLSDGMNKVLEGRVALEEVRRVCKTL